MPEINEIKKYADFLNSILKNKKIIGINILNGRYKKHKPFQLYKELKNHLPLKVIDIKTKGKFLYINFEKKINKYTLFSTLGLSGGWVYFKNNNFYFPLENNFLDKKIVSTYERDALNHLNVEFILENRNILYFYDKLSFGTMKVVDNQEEINKKLTSIGPDILNNKTDFKLFFNNIMLEKNREKAIGNVLMNQKIISGIGNYLRADILWLSKISPFRKIKDLSKSEIRKIYKNMKFLVWSIYDYKEGVKRGFIIKDRKTPFNYNRDFFVYKEETDIYGHTVIKEELYEGSKKRFIYWIPEYQK